MKILCAAAKTEGNLEGIFAGRILFSECRSQKYMDTRHLVHIAIYFICINVELCKNAQ